MRKAAFLVASVFVGASAYLDQFQSALVDSQNAARAKYGLVPLRWDTASATVAQNYANQCTFAHNPNRGDRGENIFANGGGSTTVTVDDLKGSVQSWVSEGDNYDCINNQNGGGHFTQVVWNSSTLVGCGWAACNRNSPFGSGFPNWKMVVCDYAPPGNWAGQRPFSVSGCSYNKGNGTTSGSTGGGDSGSSSTGGDSGSGDSGSGDATTSGGSSTTSSSGSGDSGSGDAGTSGGRRGGDRRGGDRKGGDRKGGDRRGGDRRGDRKGGDRRGDRRGGDRRGGWGTDRPTAMPTDIPWGRRGGRNDTNAGDSWGRGGNGGWGRGGNGGDRGRGGNGGWGRGGVKPERL